MAKTINDYLEEVVGREVTGRIETNYASENIPDMGVEENTIKKYLFQKAGQYLKPKYY